MSATTTHRKPHLLNPPIRNAVPYVEMSQNEDCTEAGSGDSGRFDFEYMTDEDGCQTLGVYVRGHHDPALVLREALAEFYVREDEVSLDDVRHTRFRKTPVGPQFGGSIDFWLCEATGRGATPVTLIDLQAARSRRSRAEHPTNQQAVKPDPTTLTPRSLNPEEASTQ